MTSALFRKLRRKDFDVSHSKQPYPKAEYTDSESNESKREPQRPLQARVAIKTSTVLTNRHQIVMVEEGSP